MKVIDALKALEDPRRDDIISFHQEHEHLMKVASGSKKKHQAWKGGYLDHVSEVIRIAKVQYPGLSSIRTVPIELDSAVVVLYFHDIEKMWKYSIGLPEGFDKDTFLFTTLAVDWNIKFTNDEKNALKYVHGEVFDYSDERKMGRLASFCHICDNLSARFWFDEGKGLG